MPTVEELVRAGGATLAFDTNAVIARDRRGKLTFSGFFWLCDSVNVLKSGPPPLDVAPSSATCRGRSRSPRCAPSSTRCSPSAVSA
jgi:hypothetical protein